MCRFNKKTLDILGNKATPADVLYAKPKELEEKIKELGLGNKLNGVPTGKVARIGLGSNIKEVPSGAVGIVLGDTTENILADAKNDIGNQETNPKAKLLPKIETDNSPTITIKGGISYDEGKMSNNINNTYFSSDSIKKAREFIQGEENFRAEAYKDTGGVWTIGYGHTKNVKPGDKITKEEAEKLYVKDFNEHIKPISEVKVPLSDNEKIALASFIYNVGPNAFKTSTLLKKLNIGDKKGAAQEFKRWIYDNGKVQKGLINRRNREMNLFLNSNN